MAWFVLKAIQEGDAFEVASLLDEDPSVLEEEWAHLGWPLGAAAAHGHVDIARLLVERGANTNRVGSCGKTVLECAVEQGHEEMVDFLVTNGAQANHADPYGKTLVMLGCERGHLGVVKALVEHTEGQGLELTNHYGMTALHFAAVWGYTEIVEFLLSKGAQPNARDGNDMTPLMNSCLEGHLSGARALVPHAGREGLLARDEEGWTVLHYAARRGYAELMRFLLVSGADPAIRDNRGRAPEEVAGEEDAGEDVEEVGEEERAARRARVIGVLEWWERECDMERRAVLCRATCLHKAFAVWRDSPTSQAPVCLEARVAAGAALPRVEVVSPQSTQQHEGASDRDQTAAIGEGGDAPGAARAEEERHAVLAYVVTGLNEELLTELLQGFYSENFVRTDEPSGGEGLV